MPGVDDGSKDLRETIAMFENAYTSGVTDMILTPHYIKGTRYSIDNQAKSKILEVLREALSRADIDINISFGNEAYIDNNLPELIASKKVSTLAGSRYLLLELPVGSEDINAGNIIFRLRSNGITPIIAHPERYSYFQDDPEKVRKYLELGCFLQGNYMSLLGKYGKKAKKTLKYLLKKNYISFLCSDIHHSHNDYHLPEAEKAVLKILKSENKVQQLFIENPERVIKNKSIERE